MPVAAEPPVDVVRAWRRWAVPTTAHVSPAYVTRTVSVAAPSGTLCVPAPHRMPRAAVISVIAGREAGMIRERWASLPVKEIVVLAMEASAVMKGRVSRVFAD